MGIINPDSKDHRHASCMHVSRPSLQHFSSLRGYDAYDEVKVVMDYFYLLVNTKQMGSECKVSGLYLSCALI